MFEDWCGVLTCAQVVRVPLVVRDEFVVHARDSCSNSAREDREVADLAQSDAVLAARFCYFLLAALLRPAFGCGQCRGADEAHPGVGRPLFSGGFVCQQVRALSFLRYLRLTIL